MKDPITPERKNIQSLSKLVSRNGYWGVAREGRAGFSLAMESVMSW